MIEVLNLSKEDRIQTIFTNILKKESQMPSFSPQYTIIDPVELMSIVQLIEDRVYYISDSPAFEYKGSTYTSMTMQINSIDDFKNLMTNHPDEFFIIYSIHTNQMIISNVGGISQPKSYRIRGNFISDPSTRRQNIINKILDEE